MMDSDYDTTDTTGYEGDYYISEEVE